MKTKNLACLTGALAAVVCVLQPTLARAESSPQNQKDPTIQNRDTSNPRDDREARSSAQSFVYGALLGGMKEVRISRIALDRHEKSEIKTFAQKMIDDHSRLNQQLTELAQKKGWSVPATNSLDGTNRFSSTGRPETSALEPQGKARDLTGINANGQIRKESRDADRGRRDNVDVGNNAQNTQSVSDRQDSELRSHDHALMQGRTTVEALGNTPTTAFDKAYLREILKDHAQSVRKYERASQQAEDEEVKSFAKENLPMIRGHLQEAKQLAQSLGFPSTSDENKDHSEQGRETPPNRR